MGLLTMNSMKYFLLILTLIFHLASAAAPYLNVGPHHNYIRMKFNNPQKLDGFLTGLTVNGGYQFNDFSIFANYEGSWTTGKLCGNPCQESRVSEQLIYGAFKYRYDFFALYLGFGYNVFNNTQDPCTADLTFRFKKLIIPLGVQFYWEASPHFTMSIQGEFRPDVSSRIRVIKNNFDSKKERAFRVQLPLICSRKHFSCQLIPFFDWNRFGRTTEKLSNCVPFDIPKLT
ncbi:MAG TPA: hypothetical protein ENI08_00940, partial [Candidatus Dependentiae bacterium]|nr:hypothetical protein [Candidatus Dependentiae bacterium]